MFSRPKILFLVSLLFVALLNPKFNPYLPFKFLIFIILVLFGFGVFLFLNVATELCLELSSFSMRVIMYIISGLNCNEF